MHRLFASLFLAFALFSFLHSGRTDANGGHWDHSSGEYHYHHGYSAHDHYDIDDDGDIDCPYDFDDKTNNDKTYGGKIEKDKTTTAKESTKTDNNEKHQKQTKPSVKQVCGNVLLALCVGYILLAFLTQYDVSFKKALISALFVFAIVLFALLDTQGII